MNLFDPELATRGDLVRRLRADGWNGRMAWVPISVISTGLVAARSAIALLQGRMPARFAAWSILRPRRYDARVTARLLDAARLSGQGTAAVQV